MAAASSPSGGGGRWWQRGDNPRRVAAVVAAVAASAGLAAGVALERRRTTAAAAATPSSSLAPEDLPLRPALGGGQGGLDIAWLSPEAPAAAAALPPPPPPPPPSRARPLAHAATTTTTTAAPEPPAVTREALGRATWTLLHTLAARFPEQPTRRQRRDAEALIDALTRVYPCGECAAHFLELCRRDPPDASSGATLQRWTCRAHNAVNARLGKPQFDCALAGARWAPEACDGGMAASGGGGGGDACAIGVGAAAAAVGAAAVAEASAARGRGGGGGGGARGGRARW
jgi:mitochondrial FAD-linked sulfhydryl oxidase